MTLQEPVQRRVQCHRRHWLLQEMVSAGTRLAEPLGRGVTADDESRNGCAQRLAQALDDLDAGLTISETKVGDDEIRLPATVRDAGKGGCARRCSLNTAPPALQDPAHSVEDKH